MHHSVTMHVRHCLRFRPQDILRKRQASLTLVKALLLGKISLTTLVSGQRKFRHTYICRSRKHASCALNDCALQIHIPMTSRCRCTGMSKLTEALYPRQVAYQPLMRTGIGECLKARPCGRVRYALDVLVFSSHG